MNNDEALSEIDAKIIKYWEFVDEVILWLKIIGNRYQQFYNAERILLIITSLSLPALSQSYEYQSLVPYLSVFIAILAALDGLFKPGEMWRHFRSYQLGLRRFKRIYEPKFLEKVTLESNIENQITNSLKLYNDLVDQIEDLLEEESSKFFEQRIQKIKSDKR